MVILKAFGLAFTVTDIKSFWFLNFYVLNIVYNVFKSLLYCIVLRKKYLITFLLIL